MLRKMEPFGRLLQVNIEEKAGTDFLEFVL